MKEVCFCKDRKVICKGSKFFCKDGKKICQESKLFFKNRVKEN